MAEALTTTCCIAGGGPAGMMAGFLLARAGIDVIVLEKHADFFRDFRGDTIHPSTLELMYELGLLEAFLELPHDEVHELSAEIGPDRLPLADFRHLPTHCKYIALMPQWDFLDFIADQARALPKFRLLLSTEATGLIEDNGRIVGITSTAGDIRAALTIAADGRHSVLREAAGLGVEDFASPMDVLWFRISRRPTDPKDTFGHAEAGRLMVLINRGTYWQIAYLIPKGGDAALRGGPIERFRADVGRVTPFLGDRVGEIAGWDQVKLLTVKVDRLARWHRPGFLAIGDAAHAMSPIGGVGVNLAVQDAVAAANRLAAPLARGSVDESVLAAIQKRREFPTKVTQGAQIAVQKRLIDPLLNTDRPLRAPWLLKLLSSIPLLRTIPAYVVGVGVRPEHIGR
ncbi:MAG TPA: FAD-dependent oxidoreductase [Devosia sp.]|nr:FAD-dependent oxidoreductase [Devosia sp.]